MNAAYERVAINLTDAENHRTETAYEDALIAKTFSFQFVNSFTSLFYVAFIKTPLAIHGLAGEIRCYSNSFAELNSTLGIIIISNIVAGNAGEIIPPIIQTRLKARSESKGMMLWWQWCEAYGCRTPILRARVRCSDGNFQGLRRDGHTIWLLYNVCGRFPSRSSPRSS